MKVEDKRGQSAREEEGDVLSQGWALAGADFYFQRDRRSGSINQFPYSTLWSKGTEEHNSAAENVWKNSPSFYIHTAYVFATNVVIWLFLFSQSVWMGISFHLHFIVEGHSTWSRPQPCRSGWGQYMVPCSFLALLAPQRHCSLWAFLLCLLSRLGARTRSM